MFTELLDVFLADFGLPCTANGQIFTGILDQPDETLSAVGVNLLSTMYQLTLKSVDVAAAALASGSGISVDGRAFVVRDVMLLDDGSFTRLTLSR